MHLNILAFAVPLFISLMYLEYRVSIRQQQQRFHFEEVIANLNVGIAERLADLFTTGLFYFVFRWLYEHGRLMTLPATWWSFALLLLVTDFIWYWYHRLGHEVNILWAAHGVHHQSEDFNFTVSARITVFQAAARCVFWSILPVLGFHPGMITVMLLIHGAYPFFTHTQTIGKLGWLEHVLVTPSHHRVHHSSNPEYLDKNYGDLLIIWDKVFGTFAKEGEAPVYGLTKPLKSYSFLWQHFHFFLELAIAFSRAKTMRGKVRIIFGRPDGIDAGIRSLLERRLLRKKLQGIPTRTLYRYIAIQTLVTIAVLFLLLLFEHYIDAERMTLAAGFVLISIINTGAMLEQRRWIFALDLARFSLCSAFIYLTFPGVLLSASLLILLAGTLLYYQALKSYYLRLFFEGVPAG